MFFVITTYFVYFLLYNFHILFRNRRVVNPRASLRLHPFQTLCVRGVGLDDIENVNCNYCNKRKLLILHWNFTIVNGAQHEISRYS